jgi:4-oxalocrotonate tautomerase
MHDCNKESIMPILNLKMSGEPSPDLTQKVATTLVELTAQILHKNPDITAVAIDFINPNYWIIGGRSLAEQSKSSFYMDIKVIDSTNTKDEKAQYIAEVFAKMSDILGELHSKVTSTSRRYEMMLMDLAV